MKLYTFLPKNNDQQKLGVEHNGYLADVAAINQREKLVDASSLESMQSLIESGPSVLKTIPALLDKAQKSDLYDNTAVSVLPPIPIPVQVRDFLAFEKHLLQAFSNIPSVRNYIENGTIEGKPLVPNEEEANMARQAISQTWYEQPVYYKCNRFATSGHDDTVIWPSYSMIMDYELEFAMVIGKGGKNITKENARDHIFGYTIFNDLSARDAQLREMVCQLGPAKGKDFDGANAMGPCIVTADEISDPYNLKMTAHVNGELWSEGTSADMYHKFEDMIAHVSQCETLHPGEIFGSGTVGNGCGGETLKFPDSGDVVELSIEGIGTLKTTLSR